MRKREISLIVAMSKNRAIGKDNKMLWHLPNDFKYFKTKTINKPVIMGRKTFESIGKALPNRQNIVITKRKEYKKEKIKIVSSLEEALKITEEEKEIFIIGGGEIYKESIKYIDNLYITIVDTIIEEADTYFPDISELKLKEKKIIKNNKDKNHKFDYKFCEYKILKNNIKGK